MDCCITRKDKLRFIISIGLLIISGSIYAAGLPFRYAALPLAASIMEVAICTIRESWAVGVVKGELLIKEPLKKPFRISMSKVTGFAEEERKIVVFSGRKVVYVYRDKDRAYLRRILEKHNIRKYCKAKK